MFIFAFPRWWVLAPRLATRRGTCPSQKNMYAALNIKGLLYASQIILKRPDTNKPSCLWTSSSQLCTPSTRGPTCDSNFRTRCGCAHKELGTQCYMKYLPGLVVRIQSACAENKIWPRLRRSIRLSFCETWSSRRCRLSSQVQVLGILVSYIRSKCSLRKCHDVQS